MLFNISNILNEKYRLRIGILFLPVVLVVSTIFVFTPLILIADNSGELLKPIAVYIQTGFILLGIISFILVYAFTLFLHDKFFEYSVCLLLILGIVFYIQANLFVWNYGEIDGSLINYNGKLFQTIIEIAAWIGILFIGLIKSKKLLLYSTLISSFFLFIQFATLCTKLEFWEDVLLSDIKNISSYENVDEFSKTKNVLVWISDGLQSDIVQEILEEDESLKQKFAGFTLYTDAVGHYKYTELSFPSMLSGEIFTGQTSYKNYIEDVVPANNIGRFLHNKGFSSNMITGLRYCVGFIHCNNYWQIIDKEEKVDETTALIINVSLFKLVPHLIKPVIFNGVEGFGDRLLTYSDPNLKNSYTTQSNDVYFYTKFVDRLNSNSKYPTFKIFHSKSPHHPYNLDMNCNQRKAKHNITGIKEQFICHLKVFSKVIKKLQELKIYENTLIIWVSDHGTRAEYAKFSTHAFGDKMRNSYVTFAIKPFNENKQFEKSPEPVQLSDLPSLILDHLNMPVNPYKKEDSNTRTYIDSTKLNTKGKVTFTKYHINGPVWDPISWSEGEEFTSKNIKNMQ